MSEIEQAGNGITLEFETTAKLFASVVTIIIGISFAIGCADLLGEVMAIDKINSLSFISLDDVIIKSIQWAPFGLLGFVIGEIHRYVFPRQERKMLDKLKTGHLDTYRLIISLLIFIAGITYATIPSVLAEIVYIILIFIAFFLVVQILNREIQVKQNRDIIINVLISVTMILTLFFFGFLREKALATIEKPFNKSLISTICVNDHCEDGIVLSRLSSFTIVRSLDNQRIFVFPNRVIKSTSRFAPQSKEPSINVWKLFGEKTP